LSIAGLKRNLNARNSGINNWGRWVVIFPSRQKSEAAAKDKGEGRKKQRSAHYLRTVTRGGRGSFHTSPPGKGRKRRNGGVKAHYFFRGAVRSRGALVLRRAEEREKNFRAQF